MGDKVTYDILDESSEIICFFDEQGEILFMNHVGFEELDFDYLNFNVRDILPNIFSDDVDTSSFVRDNVSEDIRSDVYRKNHTCFPVNVHFYYNEEADED